MPRRSLSPELKEQITQLSPKEKDKLLFRLIPKDDKLTEKLEFQLLEAEATTDFRRQEVADYIDQKLHNLTSYQRLYPGRVKQVLRHLSGRITRHLYVTRDKYGEITLNLRMLILALELFQGRWSSWQSKKGDLLGIYVVKRAQKILGLIDKIHEDYRLDFEDDLKQLAQHIQSIAPLNQQARNLGFRPGEMNR